VAVASNAFIEPIRMSPRLPLSGVVITRNEADRIGACLRTLGDVCSDIVVLDSGSSDDTVAIARAAGARVEHQDWLGFAAQKNAAIALATQPWVLLLDADERLAEGAAAELRTLFRTGQVETADVWRIRRYNWFLGRRMSSPDKLPRLMRAGVRFLPMLVHERPDTAGRRVKPSRVALEHDSSRSREHNVGKQDWYARLWAQQRHAEGRHCGPWSAWVHAAAYWLKAYVLRRGLLDGRAGWHFHKAHASGVMAKYRHLHALGRSGGSVCAGTEGQGRQ
jgi:(heptosyl)LPS beta-1,4-glucosyltransferase